MDNVEQTIRKRAYEFWERAGRPEGRSDEFWLQVVEAQLRVMIDHAPAAVAMFDRDMRYVNVSKRWLSDYSLKADVIGALTTRCFPRSRNPGGRFTVARSRAKSCAPRKTVLSE